MLIGGVAGMAAVPAWPALRTHLRWTIPIAALLGVPLSLLLTHGSHAGALYVVGIVLGVLMLAPLPLLVDSAADWAGEAHAGLAVSTFWLAGNAGAAAEIGCASCRERVCQYGVECGGRVKRKKHK